MTILALVQGALFRGAESRVSKNGKAYAKATIKEVTDEDIRWVNVVAFSDTAQAELMRLAAGDSLSVQGQLTASIYKPPEGEARVSMSIVANCVLALRQPAKERAAKPAGAHDQRPRQERLAGTWQSPADGPDDEVPF